MNLMGGSILSSVGSRHTIIGRMCEVEQVAVKFQDRLNAYSILLGPQQVVAFYLSHIRPMMVCRDPTDDNIEPPIKFIDVIGCS
jgi:hypothetical protein